MLQVTGIAVHVEDRTIMKIAIDHHFATCHWVEQFREDLQDYYRMKWHIDTDILFIITEK